MTEPGPPHARSHARSHASSARARPSARDADVSPPARGYLLDVSFTIPGPPAASTRPTAGHQDRAQAARDLRLSGRFMLRDKPGPYRLRLSVQQGRLVLDIRDADDQPLHTHAMSLSPLRRLIKDYCLIVDSFEAAMAEGASARIQAIDMGRRALHDEAAELLRQRLAAHIEVDFETARRLFTILCVLHPVGPGAQI